MIGAAVAVVVGAVVMALAAAVTGGIDIVGIILLLVLVAVGLFVVASVTKMAGGGVTITRCHKCGVVVSAHQPVCMGCGTPVGATGPQPASGAQTATPGAATGFRPADSRPTGDAAPAPGPGWGSSPAWGPAEAPAQIPAPPPWRSQGDPAGEGSKDAPVPQRRPQQGNGGTAPPAGGWGASGGWGR